MTTIHFSGPLASDLIDYVYQLKAMGRFHKSIRYGLGALDRLTQRISLPSETIDEAFTKAWLAPCTERGSNTLRGRYYLLRSFCRFLALRRSGTFVPGEALRPRYRPADPPHIYSREEIKRLLDGTFFLKDWKRKHPCPIRSKTMHAIILLLATTGIRISEALRITLEDVDFDNGVLHIRESKFKKSRLIPVSQGTLIALRRYRNLRIKAGHVQPYAPFFVSGRGKVYSYVYVAQIFRRIAIEAGLRPPTGQGPCLHDLRHTFAVSRLLLWYREGVDVMARLPLLATYLGHAHVKAGVSYYGYQIFTENLEEGLFLFEHACGTTLSELVGSFIDMYDGPIYEQNMMGSEQCPGYCLDEKETKICINKCSCAHIRLILQELINSTCRN